MNLLTALREHPDVVREREMVEMHFARYGRSGAERDLELYDRALVTACLQEAAKRASALDVMERVPIQHFLRDLVKEVSDARS